nr:branched-chain amino acid ABC transporter, permease protein [uncultured bacterium]BAH89940.1 branched-chain amino acid ABC transporter, permease protein [uncultured bacterium]BAH90352.1 branched-chain amino acid ABC transporter, permease protein [uncultured bacterium]
MKNPLIRALLHSVILPALLVVAVSFFISGYQLVLGFGFFIAVGLAISWNLVGGFAGQFALGHSMYVGIGSYTVAFMLTRLGTPIPIAFLVGALLSAALAAGSTALFLRMRDAYFSVATMALALACLSAVIITPQLGATAGIILPGDLFIDDVTLFWVSGAMAIVALAISVFIRHSGYGLELMAMRDDETAAAESGVNALLMKCSIMAISAAIASCFGALITLQKFTVDPNSAFSMLWTIQMIMMSVIGGLGTVWGPVLGAAVVFGLQQGLDSFPVWNMLATAVILLLIIRLAPGGITDLIMAATRVFAKSPDGPPGTLDPKPEK